MRVLMTGATGLIGKEIGKKLIAKGHTITVLARDEKRARQALPFPARIFQWDTHETVPDDALKDIEGVIHLAGESIAGGRWTEKRKKAILDSRVQGTRAVVRAVLKRKDQIKVFVQGSAVGFYGDTGDVVTDEHGVKGTGFLSDVTRAWEAEVDPLMSGGPRVAFVRTSMVLSRHEGAMEKLLPLFSRGFGGPLGNGKQWMSWIHIDDISSMFAWAIESEKARGVINGAAPNPVRNSQFTEELGKAFRKPAVLPAPKIALKLALGEMSDMLLMSQRIVSTKAREVGFEFKYPEIAQAFEQIVAPLRGGQHEIFREQWLPLKPDQVFPFYQDERNLETLTPEFLKFRVMGKSTEEIDEGTFIDYRLSLHGLPFKWKTLIQDWVPNKRFVDSQIKGPYAKWHHVHEFEEVAGGTLVRDRVTYKLPAGYLGDLFASWKVGSDVATIFEHRRQIIDERFGKALT